ncbi:hypothetical protein TYRP_012941 [Tyrophagus putrescentiae]|nr:hypothetical protein TYRP_012941 [Tyrophagus putrescentiae]
MMVIAWLFGKTKEDLLQRRVAHLVVLQLQPCLRLLHHREERRPGDVRLRGNVVEEQRLVDVAQQRRGKAILNVVLHLV